MEDKFDFGWYDLWMKQSKEFFETADKHLNGLFAGGKNINPEQHTDQINVWLEALKKQWQFLQFSSSHQHMYARYLQGMNDLCQQASDQLMKEWTKAFQQNKPINDVRGLYELWLNCCHDVYQKTLHTQTHQDQYGDFMNAALKFWQTAMATK